MRTGAAIWRRTSIALLLGALTVAESSARVWTTITGQTFDAEFVRVDGANGIFTVKGKEYPYPLNRLSIADRLLIGKTTNQQSAATPGPTGAPSLTTSPTADQSPSPPAAQIQLAGQTLKPGGYAEIDIPIIDPAGLQEVKKAYAKSSEKARMLIALPNDFDPAQSHPLLIVSATADGAASSIGSAHQFISDALEKKFVVIAVDGEFGKPTHGDPPSYRWALVSAALDLLHKEWPASKSWPIATTGVSGGGGYASQQALKLAQQHANLIGIFLAVSPWNPMKFPEMKQVPISLVRNVPIFLSAGDEDQTATREITDESNHAMRKAGFKKVRYEHFAGGHQLHHPHLLAALDWFLQEQGKH